MRARTRIEYAIVAAALVVGLLASGCRHFRDEGVGARLIDCGEDVVRRCWPSALPAVNSCAAETTATAAYSCLSSLIQPTACAVEQVIACVARSAGSNAAAAAQTNPADELSARKAANIRGWIAGRGYQFKE